MKETHYKVVLTNGDVNHIYDKWTFGEKQAIILAQAEAIQNGRGYELVSVREIK